MVNTLEIKKQETRGEEILNTFSMLLPQMTADETERR